MTTALLWMEIEQHSRRRVKLSDATKFTRCWHNPEYPKHLLAPGRRIEVMGFDTLEEAQRTCARRAEMERVLDRTIFSAHVLTRQEYLDRCAELDRLYGPWSERQAKHQAAAASQRCTVAQDSWCPPVQCFVLLAMVYLACWSLCSR